jgi:hypothetical protein
MSPHPHCTTDSAAVPLSGLSVADFDIDCQLLPNVPLANVRGMIVENAYVRPRLPH